MNTVNKTKQYFIGFFISGRTLIIKARNTKNKLTRFSGLWKYLGSYHTNKFQLNRNKKDRLQIVNTNYSQCLKKILGHKKLNKVVVDLVG